MKVLGSYKLKESSAFFPRSTFGNLVSLPQLDSLLIEEYFVLKNSNLF